jgi:hypothetical protein
MANPVVINNGLHVDAVAGVGVTTAQMARTSLASLVAHDANGPRLGIFYEGNQTLLTGTATTSPSMQVSVSPLAWVGLKALAEGVYIGRSTSTVLVDVAAAPASNSRIDVVYVMQRDQNATTSRDGITQGEIGVITGTAAVSPTKPAIPAGAVEVGSLTIQAGVTATTNAGCTITTTWGWTCAAGAPIPVPNQATRDGLAAYDGLRVYRLDVHQEESYNGTAWGPPVARAISTKVTSNVGGITGAADVAIVTSSAAVVGDGVKRFKITASYFTMTGTVVGDAFDFKIKDQSTGTTLTAFRTIIAPNGTEGKSFVYTDVPAAGTHVYQFTAIRGVGTGTGQVSAGAAGPAEIIVEQVA